MSQAAAKVLLSNVCRATPRTLPRLKLDSRRPHVSSLVPSRPPELPALQTFQVRLLRLAVPDDASMPRVRRPQWGCVETGRNDTRPASAVGTAACLFSELGTPRELIESRVTNSGRRPIRNYRRAVSRRAFQAVKKLADICSCALISAKAVGSLTRVLKARAPYRFPRK